MNHIHKAAWAESLGISTRTLEGGIATCVFPAPRNANSARLSLLKLSAVDAWCEAQLESVQ